MPTVALYARHSSDNQRDASIEDQLHICRERAEREGRRFIDSYSDRSVSGASLIRPGIQALMADAQTERFDIVLAESLDRISRDQEDIAGVYKRLTFAGVRMVTLSEGDISELLIGFKGTMGRSTSKTSPTRRGAACATGWSTESQVAATPTAIAWSVAQVLMANRSGASERSILRKRRSSGASSPTMPPASHCGRSRMSLTPKVFPARAAKGRDRARCSAM